MEVSKEAQYKAVLAAIYKNTRTARGDLAWKIQLIHELVGAVLEEEEEGEE